MQTDNFQQARKLAEGYHMELRALALDAITDLKRTSSEVVLICGLYCERWQKLLHGLRPDAKAELEKLKALGNTPTTVASTNLDLLVTYLNEGGYEVTPPTPNTKEDNVWVLVLIEGGHVWLELNPQIRAKKPD